MFSSIMGKRELLKEAKKLPWEDGLFHKNWKVCNETNINLASLFDSIANPKDLRICELGSCFSLPLRSVFQEDGGDSNVSMQEKAFDALIAYLRVTNADSGRYRKEVCDTVMAKCLTGRPKTVEKGEKCEGGIDASSGSQPAKDVSCKSSSTSGRSTKDNQAREKKGPTSLATSGGFLHCYLSIILA
ncbi:MOR1 protein [Spatholobus suberectus]|nr:MOR1 protein [Spatholobus suberectus]